MKSNNIKDDCSYNNIPDDIIQLEIIFFTIWTKKTLSIKICNYTATVKPVLTTTSEQRPPVNNGQSEAITTILKPTCHWSFSYNPLHNSHIFQVPRVAVVLLWTNIHKPYHIFWTLVNIVVRQNWLWLFCDVWDGLFREAMGPSYFDISNDPF